MLLQERIHTQNGNRTHYDNRHLDGLLRRLHKVRVHGVHVAGCLGQHDDLAQHDLQRPFGRVIDVQESREEAVPVAYCIEQGEGGDYRHGQGQHDPPQKTQLLAAVDPGRFLNFRGQLLEEVLDDNQVEGADGAGENQSVEGIQHIQLADNQVGRDHPAAEQHGEDHHVQEKVASHQTAPSQRIGHGHRKEQVDNGADYGDIHGYPDTSHNGIRGENELICV
ncbi:hypothetical protein D3C75_652590 [compost metagenome]